MKEFRSSIIKYNSSCLEALRKLDIENSKQTLFVLNENEQLVGTVTDGDIRRGLIKGLTIDSPVHLFCCPKFRYINSKIDVEEIHRLKKEGIKVLPKILKDGKIERIYDLSELNSILPVHAVVMAGGRGERLGALTDNTPKPMLLLANKPIIEHNIDRLISFGIEKISISVRYLAEKIKNYFGDGTAKGIKINYFEEKVPLGTIGCLPLIKDITHDAVLVLNSDLFTNIDFESLYLDFFNSSADMAVASIPYTVDIPYAIIDLHDNDIIGLKEKPKNTYYANAGIYILRKETLEIIPKNEFFNATDLIEKINYNGGKIIHSPISGYWIDIGKHDDYNKAKELIKHIK